MSGNFLYEQKNYDSFVELISDRAKHSSQISLFIGLENGELENGILTYASLDQKARAIASQLQFLELGGKAALLLYPSTDPLDFIVAFFACLYAGVIAVPVQLPSLRQEKLEKLSSIINDCNAQLVLTLSKVHKSIEKNTDENFILRQLTILDTDEVEDKCFQYWQPPLLNRKSLAFLQYTSGSTGTPKGVMVTHGNLLSNAELMKKGFSHHGNTRFCGWLPLYHDMGLIGNVIQPVFIGVTCVLMAPMAFLQQPMRWLNVVSTYGITNCGGPNFAYRLCVEKITEEQKKGLNLSSWEVAFNGAEPVLASTLKEFNEKFAECGFKEQTFYPTYGLAEATLYVSGGNKNEAPTILTVSARALEQNKVKIETTFKSGETKQLVSCGQAWLDQCIKIVNPETQQCYGEDEVGEIWVKGPSVPNGYLDKPDENNKTFKAKILPTNDAPFLRTGDLGFMHNGQLYITGRLKDLIIFNGKNHYPNDIEITVQKSHEALENDATAAFAFTLQETESICIVQEIQRTYLRKINYEEASLAIRRAVMLEHNLQVSAIIFIKPRSLLKTSSGKVRRKDTKALFLSDSLDPLHVWRQ